MTAPDPSPGRQHGLGQGADVSDLIGAKVALWLALWFLAVLVSFFLIGVVVGIIVLIGGAAASLGAFVAAIRRADEPD
jgi:4-hydroxybenzoate polyprenyltransferase